MEKYYYRFADGSKIVVDVTDEEFAELRAMDKEIHLKDCTEERHTVSLSDIDEDDPCLIDQDAFVDEILEKKELRIAVQKAMANLSREEREIVEMYFWDMKTLAEIGKCFGTKRAAVCRRLQRILEKLKLFLPNM